MKIIAKKDFSLNNIFYKKNDEVKVNNKEELIILNEKGFIKSLTEKEIKNFDKTIKVQKMKEEIK